MNNFTINNSTVYINIRVLKFIVAAVFIVFVIDFCRFTECYLPTWKYQLKNDIIRGNEKAIEFYEEKYVQNNRDLFDDDFAIRKVYAGRN